jgi:thioredoxin-like negative regulator of GroEL
MEEVILEKPEGMDYYEFIEKAIFQNMSQNILILDLASEDCVACPQQDKILTKIKEIYGDKIRIYKLDIGYEDNYNFARGVLKIKKLPSTLILFGNTKSQLLFGGVIGEEGLEYVLDHYGNGKYLCLNCEHRGSKKKGNFYKCQKYGIDIYFMDSCK